jgi:hypothetical protein
MADPLTDLSTKGVSIWLDDLSRQRLVTGSLADLVAHDHVVGVTTNPAIFAKAIAGSDAYAQQIRDLWARGAILGEALRAMTAFDVRWACDVLRPVYDATGGVDGRVSIEVDPRLAYDTEATTAEARWPRSTPAGGRWAIRSPPSSAVRHKIRKRRASHERGARDRRGEPSRSEGRRDTARGGVRRPDRADR